MQGETDTKQLSNLPSQQDAEPGLEPRQPAHSPHALTTWAILLLKFSFQALFFRNKIK